MAPVEAMSDIGVAFSGAFGAHGQAGGQRETGGVSPGAGTGAAGAVPVGCGRCRYGQASTITGRPRMIISANASQTISQPKPRTRSLPYTVSNHVPADSGCT